MLVSKKILQTTILLVLQIAFLLACSPKNLEVKFGNQTISGQVLPLNTNAPASSKLSAQESAFSCSGAQAVLFGLNADGTKKLPSLAITPIDSNGQYKFSLNKSGLKASDISGQSSYVIEVSGCTESLSRIVTSLSAQDISYGSSLIQWIGEGNLAERIATLTIDNKQKLSVLFETLNTTANLASAYSKLQSDPAAAALFNSIFNATPIILNESAPVIVDESISSQWQEGVPVSLRLLVSHWSVHYNFAFVWKLNNTIISTTAATSYTPTSNLQGPRVLTVFYGQADGAGNLDQTKPNKSKTYQIEIQNTVPAVAPALSLLTPSSTNDPNIVLQINTGAALENCESFTKLALTEDTLQAPTDDSRYTITCSQVSTQNLNYTLVSTSNSIKTLRLWAKDSNGNISSAASSVILTYDISAPVLAVTSPLSNSAVAGSTTLVGTCEGALPINISGTGVSSASTIACTSGNFSGSVTLSNTDGIKNFVIQQTDSAGNIGSLNYSIVRDTSAPSLNINSPLPSYSTQVTLTISGSCETGTTLSLGGPLVAVSAFTCNASTFSQAISLTGSDGSKSISISSTDAAGNTTVVSRSFSKDNTAPIVTIASPTAGTTFQMAVSISGNCEAGRSVTLSGDVQTVVTASCTAGTYSTSVNLTAGETIKTITTSQTDAAGNVGALNILVLRDNSVPIISIASPAANTQLQSSITLAGACETGLTVTVGGSGATATSGACNSSAFNIPVSLTGADGAKAISVTQTDTAGNTASISTTFIKDTTPPNLTITGPIANFNTQGALTIAGACETGYSIVVTGSFGSSPLLATCTAGEYSQAVTMNGSDGLKTITLTQTDQAGNSTAITRDFVLDTTAPSIAISTPAALTPAQSTHSLTGTCESGLILNITGDITATTASCASATFSTSITLSTGDGVKTVFISQTDAAGNSSSSSRDLVKDTTPPSLSSVLINNGDSYVGTPLMTVAVQGSDSSTIKAKVSEASGVDCQASFVDSAWTTYTNGLTLNILVAATDGTKKICAWLKDAAGNISVHSPVQGIDQVTYDTIQFEVGNPPRVTALTATNNTAGANFGTTNFALGDQIKISYTINDVEGLSNTPVTLSYTTNNTTWTNIVSDYGTLTGNPTTWTNDYISFNAPTSAFFRIKIVAEDSAGNTSIPIVSNTLNSGNWSVYAGVVDRGLGGSATALSLNTSTGPINRIAFHPTTGDLYAVDVNRGIVKLDVKTGVTSQILAHGSTNLISAGGSFTATSLVNTGLTEMLFDKNGFLYIKVIDSFNSSGLVFKLNLSTSTYTKVLGGGSLVDSSATANTVLAWAGGMAFDESENLYFFTNCTAGSWNQTTGTVRLLKAARNSDGSFGAISVVAGNCVRGFPTGNGPFDPLTSPISNANYPSLAAVAAFNNGNTVYFTAYGAPLKVVNGLLYKANMTNFTRGFMYNPLTNKILGAYGALNSCSVPSSGMPLGEVCVNEFSTTANGNCTADNIFASTSCAQSFTSPTLSPDGTMFFTDGASSGMYRVRYIGTDNKIRTLLGSLPFSGDGLNKSVIRGKIQSIYYKKSTELDGTTYPEGLYFGEGAGPVFGYIHPVTGTTSVLWGNQSGIGSPAAGAAIGTDLTLGSGYSDYNGGIMTFDSNGQPWIRVNHMLVKINSSKQVQYMQNSGTVLWDSAAENSAASTKSLYVYGAAQNLVLKGQGAFLIGAYTDGTATYTGVYPTIKFFDFTLDKVNRLMGGTGTGVGTSPDNATAGSVLNSTLPNSCYGASYCRIQYRADQDRLYMLDGANVRYITQPTNTAASTLATLFTSPTGSINNFSFRPDNSQIFYLRAGNVFCHDISSGKAWCNDTSLGPTSPMIISNSPPNAFTWIDNSTMLISTGAGEIYRYNLLP